MAKTFENYTISDLAKENVRNLKTGELRNFIKYAARAVEDSFETTDAQLQKSLKIITGRTGVYKRGGKYKINQGSNLKGEDLVQRAVDLQSHLSIDVFSNRYQYEMDEAMDDILRSIRKKTGINLNQVEFDIFKHVLNDAKKLSDAFDSTVVANLVAENRSFGGDVSKLVYAIHDIYQRNKSEHLGMDIEDIQDAIKEQLKRMN